MTEEVTYSEVLKKYLRFLTPDNILKRTTLIERSKNLLLLDEWISYWTKKDLATAAKIINSLKINIDKKEEYKQGLYDFLKNNVEIDITSFSKNILVYIYLEDFDKLNKFLSYICFCNEAKDKNDEESHSYKNSISLKYIKKISSSDEMAEYLENILTRFNDYLDFLTPSKIEKLSELKDLVSSIRESDNFEDYKKKIIDLIVQIKEIKGAEYLEKLQGPLEMVINILLKESNYKQIFKFLKCAFNNKLYRYHCFDLQTISMLDKAPLKLLHDDIQEIINILIANNDYAFAFAFLKRLKIKDFYMFMPKDKSEFEYFEILNKGRKRRIYSDISEVMKELFIRSRKDESYIEAQKDWINYLDQNMKNKNNIALARVFTLFDMANYDIKYIDEYFNKELNKCEKYIPEIIVSPQITSRIINVFYKIITSGENFSYMKEKIRALNHINFFRSISGDEDREEYFSKGYIVNNKTFIRSQIRNEFLKLLEDMTPENADDLIYIYMNTTLKFDYSINDFIKLIVSKDITNIKELFNDYIIYGMQSSFVNRGLYYNYKLWGILSSSFAICKSYNGSGLSLYKITGYNKAYETIEIELMENYGNYNQFVSDYKEYVDAYNDGNTFKLSSHKYKFDESDVYSLIHFQYRLLKHFDKTMIQCLKADVSNVFYYTNDYEHNLYVSNIIARLPSNKKNSYKDLLCNLYKTLLDDGTLSIDEAIYFFLNTASRYLLHLDVFIDLVVSNLETDEEIINIEKLFDNYEFICEDIRNEKIMSPRNFLAKRFVTDKYKTDDDSLYCYSFKIKEYDTKTKLIEVDNIRVLKSEYKNSQSYKKMIELLTNYLDTLDSEDLDKIRKMKRLPELKKPIIKRLLSSYISVCYEIIIKLISISLDDVYEFIVALGENNYWIYKDYGQNSDLDILENKKTIKENFLKDVKRYDFEKVIFIYNNSFIKEIISLNVLLQKVLRFNIYHIWKANSEGYIKLKRFNIKIYADVNRNSYKGFNEWCVYNIVNNEKLNIRFSTTDNERLNDIISEANSIVGDLTLVRYNLETGYMLCNLDGLKKKEEKVKEYLLSYFEEIARIINERQTVEQIYDYLKDYETINKNIFYLKTNDSKYFNGSFNANDCYSVIEELKCEEKVKDLICKIKNYIKDSLNSQVINKNNINKVFFIYTRSLLRYLIPLDEFAIMFKDIINNNLNVLDIYFKFKVLEIINKSVCKIIILNQKKIYTVNLSGAINILKDNRYLGIISFIDKNNILYFSHITTLNSTEIKLVNDLLKPAQNRDEFLDLIGRQVNSFKKITLKVINRYCKMDSPLKFLKSYNEKEKDDLNYLKDLCFRHDFNKSKYPIKVIKNIFNNATNLSKIKYIYLNSVMRYFFPIQSFVGLLVEKFMPEEKGDIIDIKDLLKGTDITVDEINNGKVISALFGDNSNIVVNGPINSNVVYLSKYDKIKNVVIAEEKEI